MFKHSFTMTNMLVAMCFIAVALSFCMAMQNERVVGRMLSCLPVSFFFALAAGTLYTRRPILFALAASLAAVGLMLVLLMIVFLGVWLLHAFHVIF